MLQDVSSVSAEIELLVCVVIVMLRLNGKGEKIQLNNLREEGPEYYRDFSLVKLVLKTTTKLISLISNPSGHQRLVVVFCCRFFYIALPFAFCQHN